MPVRLASVVSRLNSQGKYVDERSYKIASTNDYRNFIKAYYLILQQNWTSAYFGYQTHFTYETVDNNPEAIGKAIQSLKTNPGWKSVFDEGRELTPFPEIDPDTWQPDFEKVHFLY